MIWLLLIVMQLKHFIADYILQGKYMMGKFKLEGWELPLAAHCAVHLVFTFFIALSFGSSLQIAFKLCLLDFTVHFIMDMIKARPTMLGRFKSFTKEEYEDHRNQIEWCETEIEKAKEISDHFKRLKYWNYEMSNIKKLWQIKEKSNKYFWLSLGLDQTVHHLTDLAIVYLIINTMGVA